jgi:hypothetical protein
MCSLHTGTDAYAHTLHHHLVVHRPNRQAHGADRHWRNTCCRTAGDVAKLRSQHAITAWLESVKGWRPLKIAAGLGLTSAVRHLLVRGGADPDDHPHNELIAIASNPPQFGNVHCAAVSTVSTASTASTTVALLRRVTSGWSPRGHVLYPTSVRNAVKEVLMVAVRMDRLSALARSSRRHCHHDRPNSSDTLNSTGAAVITAVEPPARSHATMVEASWLPPELWLLVLQFTRRQGSLNGNLTSRTQSHALVSGGSATAASLDLAGEL